MTEKEIRQMIREELVRAIKIYKKSVDFQSVTIDKWGNVYGFREPFLDEKIDSFIYNITREDIEV